MILAAETTRSTAVPAATEVPAAGFWLRTMPGATPGVTCRVTDPTVKLNLWSTAVAVLWVWPTTLGTVTGGPRDTTRSTAEPGATDVPAAGFWLMTLPAGTEVLVCRVIDPTVRLAF